MSLTFHRAGLLLLGLATCSAPLFSLDADKWSKVENRRENRQTFRISDLANTTGGLHLRKAGETGNGVLLDRPGKTTTMDPKTNYQLYFETNLAGQIALKFTIADEKNPDDAVECRVSNLGKMLGAKENFEFWTRSLKKTGLVFDPSGYRNGAGGTMLILK